MPPLSRLLIPSLLLLATSAFAQSPPLDRERWAELREELTYEGQPEPEAAPAPAAEANRPIELGTVARYLLIGTLVLGLGLMLFIALRDYLRKQNPAPDPEQAAVRLSEVAEDRLSLSEADQLIRRAEANEQWHVAVRLHFLALLKDLQDQRRIVWRRDKTNRDYHYELAEAPDYGAFAQLVTAYEAAWYGAHPPTAAAYRPLADHFLRFRAASRSYASMPRP